MMLLSRQFIFIEGYWGVYVIGEVWVEFFFVLFQCFVEKYGFGIIFFFFIDILKFNDYYIRIIEELIDVGG